MSRYAERISKFLNVPNSTIDPGPYYSLPKTILTNYTVPEMTTEEDCVLVREALTAITGVLEVSINLKEHSVTIKVDKSLINLEEIPKAILKSGVYHNCYGKNKY